MVRKAHEHEFSELFKSAFNRSSSPGDRSYTEHWANSRRRHQARSHWYQQRARLTREIVLVS
jgi:hypothetical protein